MYRISVSFLILALTLGSFSSQAASNLDIISYGDSITAGLARTSGEVVSCPDGVSLEPGRYEDEPRDACYGNGVINQGGYQPTLVNLFTLDEFTPSISNYGFSGIRSDQMIPMISSIISARPRAEYIVIMAGSNDAVEGVSSSTVIANLASMVSLAKSRGLIPVISTVTPNTRATEFERKAREYSEDIRIYAASSGVLLADSRAALGADWMDNHSGDGLHLNGVGNTILANLIHTTLGLNLPQPGASKDIILVPILDLLLSGS